MSIDVYTSYKKMDRAEVRHMWYQKHPMLI